MKFLWPLALLVPFKVMALEAFKIQLHDRMVRIEAPMRPSTNYAITVENLSLSDVAGKFVSGGKDLKFITVKATQSKTVEFTGATGVVSFQSLAPAFQEVALVFGKGAYEIPPKQ